ncbi:branched-chain amino acid ABC transporter permease [Actinoplanes sp. KI2]|uniref:branched-chain amino acid ABC transporter permease n=1 Tax=Actinoplanes sp. KI2 TaxID=2983315 RepID=UPI0021D5F40F|nr:branched-chain amino acid ABC transporter permease [Actinoplanes sp. KI2]MCU7730114.1 branched-chain amino acid ABC transporter permease [Actinoplanes sp. KI2]
MTRPMLGVLLIAAGTLALPPMLNDNQLTLYVLLGLSAMVTIGLSILMGYAGQVSLGQASFYALGAYAAGLISVHGGPSLLGLIAAPAVAAAVALVVGVPILRLRGHQLAFATLALQLILLSLLGDASWAGGAIGLQGIPHLAVAGVELDQSIDYAYLTWAGVAVTMVVAHNLISSRTGRGLRALATSETAAAASGVPVGRYRLLVFAVSAAFAGLAGGIYAYFLGYLAPGSFPVLLSVQYVVMAVVGGLGTIWGGLLGAAAVTLIVQLLTDIGTRPGMPSYAPGVLSYAVYAVLLVVVVLFLPHGLVPALRRWWPWRRPATSSRCEIPLNPPPARAANAPPRH